MHWILLNRKKIIEILKKVKLFNSWFFLQIFQKILTIDLKFALKIFKNFIFNAIIQINFLRMTKKKQKPLWRFFHTVSSLITFFGFSDNYISTHSKNQIRPFVFN